MSSTEKVVIVTGGNGGIGFATGNEFLGNDYQVILADTADNIEIKKTGISYFSCNLNDLGALESLFRFCKEKFGRLDVLITAHGVHNSVKCIDATESDFDIVMNTNFKSIFFCCREALKLMDKGIIINIGSSVGIAADKDAPVYSASKAALHQLTKCLAQEYGRRIRVNAIAPGPIETPLLRRAVNNDPVTMEAVRKMNVRGIAQPEEVAKMIFFMASDTCQFMNGSIVPFDGGESITHSGEPP